MRFADNDGTGHPRRHGFEVCEVCYRWRPDSALEWLDNGQRQCVDRAWCRQELRADVAANKARLAAGWDANGAPTGLDANGDAA